MMLIPKKLHVTWPDQSVIDAPLTLIQHGLSRFRELNPDWVIEISEDSDVDSYLRSNLPSADWQRLQPRPFVEKTDVWRLLKIFREGGVYMDMDRLCDIAMEDCLSPTARMLILINGVWDFSQDFMASAPGNPAFESVLKLNCQRRAQGHDRIIFLGPQTYFHALTQVFFGEIMEIDPGAARMNEISQCLQAVPWLQVYHEEPPFQTFIHRRDSFSGDYARAKQELYDFYRLAHWETQL